jgi:hypothetical protein
MEKKVHTDHQEASSQHDRRDVLVDDKTLGKMLGLSPSYLRKLRVKGGGPPFIRLAAKAIRYRVGDALGWASAKTANSTAAYGEPK